MSTHPRATHIDRREAIKRVSVLFGGATLLGGTQLLTACSAERPPSPDASTAKPIGNFSVDDQRFLDEVADTILPTTEKSLGAKAAATGPFMALMVTDTYLPEDQTIFRTGLRTIDDNCRAAHNVGFMQATPEQRLAVLEALDREQYEYQRSKSPEEPTHFFRMMKELALTGFFTSEIGYTQAMRYKETPGDYQPCVPYTKGETIWAPHA